MELYFVRHAIAVDADGIQIRTDEERYLTEDGAEKFRKSCKTLAKVISRLDVVYTSPLVRARQTADILVERFGASTQLVETTALAPGVQLEALRQLIDSQPLGARLAFVGHEPDLSMMISLIVTGDPDHAIRMKKGAVCRVDCGAPVRAGQGELVWLLQPKLLRELI